MPAGVNTDYLVNMLTLRYSPTGKPLIRKRSWRDFTPSEAKSPQKTTEDLISNEVRRKVEEAKPRGVSIGLSGGVDSTLVLSIIRNIYPSLPITAASVTFSDEMDESDEARRIAELFDCDSRVVSVENPLKDLKRLITMVGEPRWNLYFYYVIQEAGRHNHLMLTGDGGDELFEGYTFRYKKFSESVGRTSGWTERAALYVSCHERDWVPDQEKMFGHAIRFDWQKIYSMFREFFDNPLDPLSQVFLADFDGKLLFDWVPANTHMYSNLGVDGFAPLLQEPVIDFATHIPPGMKYNPVSGEGKLILRNILKNHGVEVRGGKRGFGMDLPTLWRRYGKDEVSNSLSDDSMIFTSELVSRDWFLRATRHIEATMDPRYINKMLGLLALEFWLNSGQSSKRSDDRRGQILKVE